MTFAIAAPLMHIDCDMPCCSVEMKTNCDMTKTAGDSMGCDMSMKKCDHSQFIPIVSGPKSEQKSKNIDHAKPTCMVNLKNPGCKRMTNTAFLQHPPEPPPKFITPLLL